MTEPSTALASVSLLALCVYHTYSPVIKTLSVILAAFFQLENRNVPKTFGRFYSVRYPGPTWVSFSTTERNVGHFGALGKGKHKNGR